MKLRPFTLCLASVLLVWELTHALPIDIVDYSKSGTLIDDVKSAAESGADSSTDASKKDDLPEEGSGKKDVVASPDEPGEGGASVTEEEKPTEDIATVSKKGVVADNTKKEIVQDDSSATAEGVAKPLKKTVLQDKSTDVDEEAVTTTPSGEVKKQSKGDDVSKIKGTDNKKNSNSEKRWGYGGGGDGGGGYGGGGGGYGGGGGIGGGSQGGSYGGQGGHEEGGHHGHHEHDHNNHDHGHEYYEEWNEHGGHGGHEGGHGGHGGGHEGGGGGGGGYGGGVGGGFGGGGGGSYGGGMGGGGFGGHHGGHQEGHDEHGHHHDGHHAGYVHEWGNHEGGEHGGHGGEHGHEQGHEHGHHETGHSDIGGGGGGGYGGGTGYKSKIQKLRKTDKSDAKSEANDADNSNFATQEPVTGEVSPAFRWGKYQVNNQQYHGGVPLRNDVWHCRDILHKSSGKKSGKKLHKRFCVPLGYHGGHGWPFFHGYRGSGLGTRGWGWPMVKSNVPEGENSDTEVQKEDTAKQSEKESVKDSDSNSNDNQEEVPKDQIPASVRRTIHVGFGYENKNSAAKKQTIHVGYGYASGDDYRLGYGMRGMGGVSNMESGLSGVSEACAFGDPSCHSIGPQVRSDIPGSKYRYLYKRHVNSFPHGGEQAHGHAAPYGHPVTHPGFTTIGFPGSAMTTTDARNNILQHDQVQPELVKTKRQIYTPFEDGLALPVEGSFSPIEPQRLAYPEQPMDDGINMSPVTRTEIPRAPISDPYEYFSPRRAMESPYIRRFDYFA